MEAKIIILIISALINIFLGILIYSKSKKGLSNILFSFITFFVGLWSIGLLFFIHAQSLSQAFVWVKFYYIAASFIASVFLHFCLVFLNKKKLNHFLVSLLYFFPILLIFVFLFDNFLIKDIRIIHEEKDVTLNLPYYSIYGAWYVIMMGMSFVVLFKKYFRSIEIEKIQIKYILSGTLTSALVGMYFNLILPWFGNYKLIWLGPVATLILVIVMAYAITRYHVLNIKVIATEILTTLMAIILLVKIPISKTTNELVFNLLFFHIFLIIGILLIRTVWLEIHRVEEIEKLNKEKLAAYDQIKKQADELKEANTDLHKLLEMKTEFMRTASHQLRTPTSSIKGMLSMLVEGDVLPEKRDEFIKMIYESSEKLSNIIRDILSATSIEAGKFNLSLAPTNISEIVQEVAKEHKTMAEQKKITLNVHVPSNLPLITADPYWLKQIMGNLIDNAIFYTPRGEVDIEVKNNSDNISIGIQDTGVGITPEDKERLFKKFTRGKNAQQVHPDGSGLGLYIVKNILNFHRGSINIESEGQGKGTAVKIVLPKG